MSGNHRLDSHQCRTSDKVGKLRHHPGSQGTGQVSHIHLFTPPRLHTNPLIQELCTRLCHRFGMELMSLRQRLHCSTREHTLQTPSQQATRRTTAQQVPTAAPSLRPADTALDHCTFLNLLQSLRPRAGQETCKCPAEQTAM